MKAMPVACSRRPLQMVVHSLELWAAYGTDRSHVVGVFTPNTAGPTGTVSDAAVPQVG